MSIRKADRFLSNGISRILDSGKLLTIVLMCVGGGISLFQHGHEIPQNGVFHSEPVSLRTVSGIFGGALNGDGPHLIMLAVLVLFATPVIREAFSCVAFARERDRVYAIICAIILTVISYSFWSAI